VRQAGGKWYVLVVVDDYSWYAWVFFLEEKGETFGFEVAGLCGSAQEFKTH
jgi:hypothetical protein